MTLATARVAKIIEWIFASPRVLGSSAIFFDPVSVFMGDEVLRRLELEAAGFGAGLIATFDT